jgi:hypothetical protein
MKPLLFVLFLLCPILAVAQDHTATVAQVKAHLQAGGVNLSGPCGAFEITKRVAWQLRGENAGLLSKPDGNNCESYAVDIIAYPSGVIVDMIISAGDDNGPTWNILPELVDPSRWRPAFDPGDDPGPPDDPPDPDCPPCPECPPCPPSTVDLSGIEQRLTTLEAGLDLTLEGIAVTRQSLEEHRAAVREGKNQVLGWLKDWKNYIAIVGGILAGIGIGQ